MRSILPQIWHTARAAYILSVTMMVPWVGPSSSEALWRSPTYFIEFIDLITSSKSHTCTSVEPELLL